MATHNSVRISRGSEGGQSLAVTTSTAATTNAIGAESVVLYSTVECFVLAGATPTATVLDGTPVPANAPIRFTGLRVTDKIAAIAAAGSGTLYIRPDA